VFRGYLWTAGRRSVCAAGEAANKKAARQEHFQEKRIPVFRPKMRQNKELEPHSDSIGMGKALGPGGFFEIGAGQISHAGYAELIQDFLPLIASIWASV
jgi:hypothetical protein